MRELKFKAIRLEVDKYEVADPFSIYEYVMGSESEEIRQGAILFPAGTLFLQFTGLKDKNGKEIYEGDLMSFTFKGLDGKEWKSDRYIVTFFEGKFIASAVGEQIVVSGGKLIEGEVIGNIYENPEMIGNKK